MAASPKKTKTPSKSKSKPKSKPKKSMHNTNLKVGKDELLGYYRDMMLIRRFEEKAGQLYGMGQIAGFCGKGGSMHMFSTEKKFYGGHGIVGAQVPLGAGLGFANKYLDNGAVSLAFFGDGASNQGQVYETFNMAKLWDLPVVFVIENNQYAMGTSVERSSAETELFKRGSSFEIEGIQVDGMNVVEVRDAAKKAIDHARDGKGPMILEMKTYRYRGHSMSDPAKYRSRDEVTKTRSESDPIDMVRARLLTEKWADEDGLKVIDKEIKEIVADAADFAQTSPEPDPSELWTDVLLEA